MPPVQNPMIPKAPSTTSAVRSTGVNLIFTLGFLLALTVGLSYVLLMAYNSYLDKSVVSAQETLNNSQKQFEPKLITELTTVDKQLQIASVLLGQHTQVSPLFKIIESSTSLSVQYDTMQFSAKANDKLPEIKIKGQANSYQAIAAQSAIFAANDNIAEHIFSNFLVNQNGKVEFDLRITPSPDILYYEKWFENNQQDGSLLPGQVTVDDQLLPSDSTAPVIPLSDNSTAAPVSSTPQPDVTTPNAQVAQ